jgi:hypothetical protein
MLKGGIENAAATAYRTVLRFYVGVDLKGSETQSDAEF